MTARITDEKINAIHERRAAGETIAQIAEELGISDYSVKKYAKGVERPRFKPLTLDIVKATRREYTEDKTVTVVQLAERYGLDPLNLARTLKGEKYAWIQNPGPLAALRHEPELQVRPGR